MRVALDATPLLGSPTGVATFTAGLLRALAMQPDVDPRAFALSLRGWRRLAAVLPDGVPAVRRPLPAGVLSRAWQAQPRPTAERLLGGDLDVVHGTNYVVPPTTSAGAVVTVYDLTAMRFPEMVEAASLRYPELVRRAVERGALVHVTARAIGDEVVEMLGVPADRVRVVHSGVDGGEPNTIPGDAERGRRMAGATRYVLALGTVEPRKGLPDLVAAFDAMSTDDDLGDVGLAIVGPDGWGVDELVAAIDASPARRRIRRIGWVGDDDRRDLLAGAAVLAMPSRYEGFGYPPLEAMAAGVPVVATTAGSLPEVLGDAALLVEPRDIGGLAGALRTALRSADAARAATVARGKAHAASFRWETCARAMVDLYRDAMDARRT
ncbi:MAG TPA: glycosyltransferase family 1 protein [Acidimicrobiales bacterium]|jgi:glycosyltransferase involved in cell wall biosynthesis|nr:glycosyltransferase family 1 protein [Acidimicrobiales bacterium]